MMKHTAIVAVLLVVTLIGAGLAIGAGMASMKETGEWLGYPLPTRILVVGTEGVVLFVGGVLGLAAVAVLAVAEWAPVRRLLHIEVAPEGHVFARVGRGILRANRAWQMLKAIALLAILLGLGVYQGGAAGAILSGFVVLFVGLVLYARRTQRGAEPRGPTTP